MAKTKSNEMTELPTRKRRAVSVRNLSENRLIRMLQLKMAEEGCKTTEMAQRMGVRYSYLAALVNGNRDIKSANRETFEAFSKLLEIPVAQAYLMAGKFTPGDFVTPGTRSKKVKHVFELIKKDPQFKGILPEDVKFDGVDKDLLLLIVLLYCELNGLKINSLEC